MTVTRDLLQLARPRVALLVAAASLFGGALHDSALSAGVFAAAVGAFVLCAGCSALNQVQERATDGLMDRTRFRPLPAGRMSARTALIIALCCMFAGLALFALTGGTPLMALGFLVVIVYNGLYTPLKKVTPLALLVGGVAGALPPLTGWLASGGHWSDPHILAATAVYYLWQVPHFWLLAERHADDYARAGLPQAAGVLPRGWYRGLMALWVMVFFAAAAGAVGPGLAPLTMAPPSAGLAAGLVAGLALGSIVARWALTQRTELARMAVNAAIMAVMLGMLAVR